MSKLPLFLWCMVGFAVRFPAHFQSGQATYSCSSPPSEAQIAPIPYNILQLSGLHSCDVHGIPVPHQGVQFCRLAFTAEALIFCQATKVPSFAPSAGIILHSLISNQALW